MKRLPGNFKGLVGLALLFLLVLVIVLGIVFFPVSKYVPATRWGAALESAGYVGILLFLGASVLSTSIGLPRQLVAFIGGLAYGAFGGLLLSLIAAICGCLLTATVSRLFFASFVSARFPEAIATLNKLTQNNLFLKILILRLQPLGTNLITNLCIGFTTAPLSIFLGASAFGYIPQMLVFSLLGDGVRVDSQEKLVVSGVLLLISVLLGVLLYRKEVVPD